MAETVADRIAKASLEKREAAYATEVRRLLDAGLDVMRRCGTTSRPRVADIVAAAGLSNEAFYRHFPSKDALVAAILEDGSERLRSYLEHQMAKAASPADRIRRWTEGVLDQAVDPEIAASTAAVLWNASGAAGPPSGHVAMNTTLATLLREPFAALGSDDPELDAALASHAVLGRLAEHLQAGTHPSPAEVERTTAFCLRVAGATPG